MPASMNPDAPLRLYRCYDADGVLLYIGLTQNFAARWPNHDTYWTSRVTRVELSEIVAYSRMEGKRVEAEAIKSEVPLFNREHADIRHAEALIQYAEKAGIETRGMHLLREKYAKRQIIDRAISAATTGGTPTDTEEPTP